MSLSAITTRTLREKLSAHFGFRQFRPGQARVVRAALEGRDVVVIMPTGSGKSLCFQLPGMELQGITLVISPLIALMKDQVDRLREQGIRASFINSTLSAEELREVEADITSGQIDFVYTTPERIAVPEYREILTRRPIDLFVVDEAHCVSQWGHSFRPDYLSLGVAVKHLGNPPVLALTASATDEIIADIIEQLGIPEAEVVHTGFYRPNIALRIVGVEGEAEKDSRLIQGIHREGPGIVYAATTGAVDRIAESLQGIGVKVAAYHGRMSAKRRKESQDRFMSGDVNVMVATNAFGLGIDKPNIRFVIHYHMPGSVEAYYQEIGRAGRDGLPAEAVAFYAADDEKLQKFLAATPYPDDSDLVNAYHAIELAIDQQLNASTTAIFSKSPLPKNRMKVCLALFESKGVTMQEKRGQHRLLKPDLTRDQLEGIGQSARLRAERLTIRQQQMRELSGTSRCRWDFVLEYFDDKTLADARCGHCDNCSPHESLVPAP